MYVSQISAASSDHPELIKHTHKITQETNFVYDFFQSFFDNVVLAQDIVVLIQDIVDRLCD